jgi:hypothetical protein
MEPKGSLVHSQAPTATCPSLEPGQSSLCLPILLLEGVLMMMMSKSVISKHQHVMQYQWWVIRLLIKFVPVVSTASELFLEVLAYKIGKGTDYMDVGFSWLHSAPPGKCSHLLQTRPWSLACQTFHIHWMLSFPHTIWYYITVAVDSIIK